jgi:hypothetical protein
MGEVEEAIWKVRKGKIEGHVGYVESRKASLEAHKERLERDVT